MRHWLSLGALMSTSVLLLGCQKAALLNPKGPVASEELKLLITAVLLMLIVVLPVIILSLVISHRYRASNKSARYEPGFHSVKLEIFWWIIPLIIVVILGVITWITTHSLDPYRPLKSEKKAINIQAVSLNWRWLFIYPDQKIATLNLVEFPVGTPVNFKITSDAPMNSFMIQQLAGQIYAMAGMQTKLSLMADEKGDYRGLSMSFSGDGYDDMIFTARAVDPAAFAAWVNSVRNSRNVLNFDTYQPLVADSHDTSVKLFKLTDDQLFREILDKYMKPTMNLSAQTK